MKPHPSLICPRRRCAAPVNAQRGVLLLEVLISILIFSLALLGLVGLQARAIQYSVDAEDRSRASLLANQIVAAMWLKRSTDTADLGAEIAAWEAQLSDPGKGGLRNGAQEIKHWDRDKDGVVTIKITWDAPDKSAPLAMTTRTYETKVVIPQPPVSGGAEAPEESADSES
jgi:type IV pilus assembly protein PilV